MNIAIALLSVLILHLTILVLSIDIKLFYRLIKLVVPIHFLPMLLCLLTSLAYLFEKELSLFHLDIRFIDIVINNMPKYLLSMSLILSIINLRKCWIIVFEFFDAIFETEENKQKE